jgi:hypothetical protein
MFTSDPSNDTGLYWVTFDDLHCAIEAVVASGTL